MNPQRPRTRAEERIAELDTSVQPPNPEIEQLRGELEQANQEAAENKAAWQRTAADFANYKRRTEHDREQTLGLANESLLAKLLVIVDDFDRAIANMPPELRDMGWVEGIAAIDRKLDLLLASEGLSPIEAVGKQFDPHEHEAVAQEERPEVADGTVIAELQRGFRIRDRVLRPAMVVVSTGGPVANDGTATNDKQSPNQNFATDSGGIN